MSVSLLRSGMGWRQQRQRTWMVLVVQMKGGGVGCVGCEGVEGTWLGH